MSEVNGSTAPQLRRTLRLRDLVLYGIVIIQPTAPMPIYGVVSQASRGHVASAILLAMVAMLFTAVSYGRMAQVYPSAGSAYTYVREEIHPTLGFVTGWSLTLDYLLNPLICTIWCSKAIGNFFPQIPYALWAVFFVVLFAMLNLRGVETTARTNFVMTAVMSAVVLLFFVFAIHFAVSTPHPLERFLLPFYNPETFSVGAVSRGTAIAVLTYIGFDAVSTLSEEAQNPHRDILRATVLTCLITGVLATVEVYLAQLAWPDFTHYPDVDTAFVFVASRVGGHLLYLALNLTILMATVGSGFASQMAAARLLFGMGRDDVLPRSFFGSLSARRTPDNGIFVSAAIALVGALLMSYSTGAELLNFGAFIAFIGVNLCAFLHAWRAGERTLSRVLPPLLGALVCLYIWLHLSPAAKFGGAAWLLCGLLYAVVRERWTGIQIFRRKISPS